LQLLKQSNDVAYAYIFNGRLSPVEFLQYLASDLGLPAASKNKGELLLQIAHYVIDRSQKKLTTALVVDEAHHLSPEILEEIRLLTNLETPQQKLLQILLVGQPELDEKLDSVSLRQLKQRISLRSHLVALNSDETKGYIERRLQLAGCAHPSALFPPETIAAVYQHSQGLPRLINTICENALIAAYGRQMRSVSPDIIDDIAIDFRLGVQTPSLEANPNREIDAQKAAQTLLELYAHLQAEQKQDGEGKTRARLWINQP
jgi:general secretion pathway protein A